MALRKDINMLGIAARIAPKLTQIARSAFSATPKRVGGLFSKASQSKTSDAIGAGTKAAQTTAAKSGGVTWKGMAAFSAATAAAPAALAWLDNSTDNALSKQLWELPFGQALETFLTVDSAIKSEKAEALANGVIIEGLVKSGHVSRDDKDFAQTQKISLLVSHLTLGNATGAAQIATDLDISEADAVSAYNKAKKDNPDASLSTVSIATFSNIKNTIAQKARERKQRQKSKHAQDNNRFVTDIAALESRQNESASEKPTIRSPGISDAFNHVAENSGFIKGLVMSVIVTFLDIFMDKEDAQKLTLGFMGAQLRTAGTTDPTLSAEPVIDPQTNDHDYDLTID